MEEIGEIRVEEYDHAKKIMYLAKEMLLNKERINIIAGTNSSPIATKAAQNLVRFGYVTFENIQTLTEVKNDRRFIKLILTIKKTSDFKKIYDQNKEDNKKKEEQIKKINNSKLNENIKDELTKQIDFLQKGILSIAEQKSKREANQNSEIYKKKTKIGTIIEKYIENMEEKEEIKNNFYYCDQLIDNDKTIEELNIKELGFISSK